MFNFDAPGDSLDERSDFVNSVCKLLVQKHGGDIDKALEEYKEFDGHFHGHVRNVYELSDREIPMMGLHDLLNDGGADNYGITEEEYQECVVKARKACVDYYVD